MLLQLDDLPSYCVLIGATNHSELLDRATWRRFEIRLDLERPNDERMTEYFANRLKEYPEKSGCTPKRLCAAVGPKSVAEAKEFFRDLQRRLALEQGQIEFRALVKHRVTAWTTQHRRYDGESPATKPVSV